jgi:hypothetical protein
MTIIETARALGIKITSAEDGTAVFQCWADRVEQADSYDFAAKEFGDGTPVGFLNYPKLRDAAIADANRYAI